MPPVAAERLRRDAHPGRALAALVLGDVDEARHPPHDGLVVAELDDLAGRAVLLDVRLEDRVEHLVRRQALVVALVGAQLGRRRLGDDGLGDDLAPGPLVDVPAQARRPSVFSTSLMTA